MTVKVSSKLTKVDDSFTVNMYDNGYLLTVGGRNSDEDWSTAKIMCQTVDELFALIGEINQMERD
jgi:hypothetical protein